MGVGTRATAVWGETLSPIYACGPSLDDGPRRNARLGAADAAALRLLRTLLLLTAASAVALGCERNQLASGEPTVLAAVRMAPHGAGTIMVGRPRDASSLDPALITDNESVEVCDQIYDRLLNFKPGSTTPEPGLATHWEVTEGGRLWTFHLRRGVKFHDGTAFNAEAVVFSFERQRDPFHKHYRPDFQYWSNNYRNIVNVDAVDEFTVRIGIDEPYAPFAANLAMFPVSIVSPTAVEVWDDAYGHHPAGTGPFKLERWDRGDRIVLARNSSYWGGAPTVERIVFQSIPDARQRLVALESGHLDIAYSILPEELQFVELHPELVLHKTDASNVTYMAMNTTHPPFDDVRVRRAVNYAVNKEPIVKLIYQGQAIAAQGPLPPTQWGYYQLEHTYEHSPQRARELLAEAAAEGRFDPNKIHTLYVPSDPRLYLPDPDGVARVLKANLEAVGIKTKLVVRPFAPHMRAVQAGEHDMAIHGWVGDNGDPDNFLYVLFDRDNTVPGVARNLAFFRDAELHGLLTWAQQSDDRNERIRYYVRAQKLIHSMAPWVPLAHSKIGVAARYDLAGLSISPNQQVSYRTVRRIIR